MGVFLQAVLIGFLGAALCLSLDKCEPDKKMAHMLKSLVVIWGGAAILHKAHLFGHGFF